MHYSHTYHGRPDMITREMAADRGLEGFPYRTHLALQVQAITNGYPLDLWRVMVAVDVAHSDAQDAITMQVSIQAQLGR